MYVIHTYIHIYVALKCMYCTYINHYIWLVRACMYIFILLSLFSTECIKLITEIPSTTSTNVVTSAITHITARTTVTTATIVTSSSVSVATSKIASPQNSAGTYAYKHMCAYVHAYVEQSELLYKYSYS